MKSVYFCDFDGTITKVDTCLAMVEAFAGDGWRELDELWAKKKISTEECANRTFQLFRGTLDDVERLLQTMEIDDYFQDFLALCRQRQEQVYVLSDGYDFNIETIFKKYGINLPYYANMMLYKEGFRIRCLHTNPDCGKCGTCKLTLMKRLAGEGVRRVYIGDGYSDICPSRHANQVYAKGLLNSYCLEQGMSVTPFNTFKDIIANVTAIGQ